MDRHTESTPWGELRSALHMPGQESWAKITTILQHEHPEHEHLCAYAEAQLQRWPRQIARPIPDDVLIAMLQGSDLPAWCERTCNALHLVRSQVEKASWHPNHTSNVLGISHVPGLVREDGMARQAELLVKCARMDCASLALDELEWDPRDIEQLVELLDMQDDLRGLSLAFANMGKRIFARLDEVGAFARLERLHLDGNQIGRKGVRTILSTQSRWSAHPIREFSWSLADLGSGELTRLVQTPWFGDLSSLNIMHNPLREEGLLAWSRAEHPPNLRRLEIHVDLSGEGITRFSRLDFLSNLDSLYLFDLPFSQSREPTSGEHLAALVTQSVWSQSVRDLSIWMARPVSSFDALESSVLPPQLRSLSLRVYRPCEQIEDALGQLAARHPEVTFRLGNRTWWQDEHGEWSWEYRGLNKNRARWWRAVDDGRGWR